MAAEPAQNQSADSYVQPAVVIIKRRKKGHQAAAHHGGAWKVAYADFVTAMMAFFLLLWLLNATTQEQKLGISNYFAPEAVSYSKSGAGGMLSGRTLSSPGPASSSSSPVGIVVSLPRAATGDTKDESEKNKNEDEDSSAGAYFLDPEDSGSKNVDRVRAAREEADLVQAEKALRRAIQDTPELRRMAGNLVIERSAAGLHIQIIDQERLIMFPLGSSVMHPHTKRLLKQVVEAVRRLPNKISIAGHTDSKPYSKASGYGNWELSSDRAHASRRALVELGLAAERITSVVGKADREPLIEDDPEDPRNRRISIIVLRETALPKPDPPASSQHRP